MTNFKKTILLMVLSIGLNLTAIAQVSGPAREVKGVVVDATGEPVIGASIVEKKNRTNGLVSDVDGKFSTVIDRTNNYCNRGASPATTRLHRVVGKSNSK